MGPLQDIRETWARFLNDENAAWVFVRARRRAILAISLIVLIPCFWHKRIEAGDLASHVYNAWLAQLIQKGQAPGLYIAPQWNNMLFDVSLLHIANLAGFAAAQKIMVSVCVLIFFWGVFGFIAALTERPPWLLTPCMAMLAYGFSFNMGFMNYYLSVGLACFALAILWQGRGIAWFGGAVFAALALLAHPIGFLWFAATLAYRFVWRRIPEYWRLSLPAACIAGFFVLRWRLENNPAFEVDWLPSSFLLRNGADQLLLFGHRDWYVYGAALGWGAVSFLFAVRSGIREKEQSWKPLRLALELFFLAFCTTALLPENLRSPLYAGWIGLLVSRLTTVTAIFGLAVLASVPLRRWMAAGFLVCASVFFAFLYQNTATLNELEANAEKIAATLPFGTRIVPVINAPGDWRVQFIAHAVERACIGRCFSFSNYEPSSGEFRIRVRAGSRVVTDSVDVAESMASGDYVVQAGDLPLTAIYQCGDSGITKLCAGRLAAGKKTEEPEDTDDGG
ncbi:MAG TPA: EpsG family protein [Candidatus Angelobacter sp.]|nr:EpsG family protein [Candidatus Angelobacter sp.]